MTERIDATPPDPAAMAWYELNDMGNARRLADLAMGKLLWVEDHWRAYDGKRWSAADGERLAQRLAQDVARHIPIEAEALIDQLEAMEAALKGRNEERYTERVAALFKHAIQTGNKAKTEGLLAQAKATIWARREDFDRDTLAFNCRNGTLRLRPTASGYSRPDGQPAKFAVEFRPHDPADMIGKLAAVDYDPEAKAEHWRAHMATVLPNAATRFFFQQACGYGATGENTEQAIFLLQGKGGDGKSTTMNALRDVLADYAANADVETFMVGSKRNGGEASPELMHLSGDVRMVSTGEPRPGGAIDEGRIKAITGGSAITARALYGALVEYVPRFKVFFECNRKPRISGDDDGIWRRVMVIWFPHQFKGTEIDKQAQRRLLEDGPGILNWLIEGALAWLEAGALTPPEEVQEAIDDYRRAANPFGEWFGECVDTRDPAARTLSKDLYASYKAWCDENSVGDREIMSSTAFGRALSDKQIPKMKDPTGRVLRKGARLKGEGELGYAPPRPRDDADDRQAGDPGPSPDGYGDWPIDEPPPGF